MELAYSTEKGSCFKGTVEEFLDSNNAMKIHGSVDLVFTSPPFPLNRKKKYGNLNGHEYIDWLSGLAMDLRGLLRDTGSLVIELGNAWEPGKPVMSTLALEALLAFVKAGEFQLCQQFVWHNPARLPSPVQWVNKERIRVKDAFTHLWWMSTTDRPKADNRRVLKAYSTRMRQLLDRQSYNAGQRPSEHTIGKESFLTDHGGAIPSNVISVANTQANTNYLKYCRDHHLTPHPARMPPDVAEFFVKFLTEPGDLILDPFAGSNTTGAAAECLGRKWIAIEPQDEYIAGSRSRFA